MHIADLIPCRCGGPLTTLWCGRPQSRRTSRIPDDHRSEEARHFPTLNARSLLLVGGSLSLAATSPSTANDLFEPPVFYPAGDLPFDVTAGDLNGDSAPDLVVANIFSEDVTVRFNDGVGGFPLGGATMPVGAEAPIAVAVGRPERRRPSRTSPSAGSMASPTLVILLQRRRGGVRRAGCPWEASPASPMACTYSGSMTDEHARHRAREALSGGLDRGLPAAPGNRNLRRAGASDRHRARVSVGLGHRGPRRGRRRGLRGVRLAERQPAQSSWSTRATGRSAAPQSLHRADRLDLVSVAIGDADRNGSAGSHAPRYRPERRRRLLQSGRRRFRLIRCATRSGPPSTSVARCVSGIWTGMGGSTLRLSRSSTIP